MASLLKKETKQNNSNHFWFNYVLCQHQLFTLVSTGNLPDPGKAQDFVKKLAQVLDDDERIRDQLETLVSPSCSCKQAEVCVVSFDVFHIGSQCCALSLIFYHLSSGFVLF